MNTTSASKALSPDTAINQAVDFLHQYYNDTVNHDKPAKTHSEREKEVLQQLRSASRTWTTHI